MRGKCLLERKRRLKTEELTEQESEKAVLIIGVPLQKIERDDPMPRITEKLDELESAGSRAVLSVRVSMPRSR